jgi:ubiquitin C-terminal hydrolase
MQGLCNRGNNCYVSAIVQALRYSKPVVRRLCRVYVADKFVNAFCNILYMGCSDIDAVLNSMRLIAMDPHAQSDAHEFFLSSMNYLYDRVPDHLPDRGETVSTLRCDVCAHTLVNREKMLSVSINGDVLEGLTQYERGESVSSTCEGCGSCAMTKTLTLHPGEMWVVHLKRFAGDHKLHYGVSVPPELIRGGSRWKLTAVCNHFGNMYAGHYTTLAHTDTGWYVFNDECVSPVDGVPESSRVPYILFYTLNTLTATTPEC